MERMNANRIFLAVCLCSLAALLSSCGATFMVAADDMYGTMPSRAEEKKFYAGSTPTAQTSPSQEQQKTSSYSTATSYSFGDEPLAETGYTPEADTFNYDDYYDYEYTSRLRRFHDDNYVSNDYYSDYYTNNYWYDRDPYYYGTSIYLGYNWWTPYYYRPSWYYDWRWGWNYGWGYSGWGWTYGSPYAAGYWNGYWNGRWDSYYGYHGHHHYNYCDWGYDRPHDYCYNPYDRNTYNHTDFSRRLYGSGSMNRPVVLGGGTQASVRPSFSERYETAVSTASRTAAPARQNTLPSKRIEQVSSRLEAKAPVAVKSRVSSGANGSRASETVQPAQNLSRPTQTTRPAQAAAPAQVAHPTQATRQMQSSHQATPTRPTQVAPSGNQPRQYSSPVYNNSRSSSSYTNPQYNGGSRPTTTAPSRPVSSPTQAPSRPASSPAPSRPASGSSAPSRPASSSVSHSSSGSSHSSSTPSRSSSPSRR